jgi:hypothetical protein
MRGLVLQLIVSVTIATAILISVPHRWSLAFLAGWSAAYSAWGLLVRLRETRDANALNALLVTIAALGTALAIAGIIGVGMASIRVTRPAQRTLAGIDQQALSGVRRSGAVRGDSLSWQPGRFGLVGLRRLLCPRRAARRAINGTGGRQRQRHRIADGVVHRGQAAGPPRPALPRTPRA